MSSGVAYGISRIIIDDLKKIEVGMDVFELVEAAGLPSRSTFALMSYVPIFEAGDGSYAVVQLNEDSLVETVKIRTADELSRDLREGMGEEDIPQDGSVIRCGKYALYEANGRWCIALIEESVISKVKYYESYDWENESFDKVFAAYNEIQRAQGLDLSKYKKKELTRYTFEVTNYADHEGTVYANVLVYRNKVVGGDICSAELSGFVHGFEK